MIRHFNTMTKEEKERLVRMNGEILLCLEERRPVCYMAERLNLEPWQVEHNIDEILYVMLKSLGVRRYLKALFMK